MTSKDRPATQHKESEKWADNLPDITRTHRTSRSGRYTRNGTKARRRASLWESNLVPEGYKSNDGEHATNVNNEVIKYGSKSKLTARKVAPSPRGSLQREGYMNRMPLPTWFKSAPKFIPSQFMISKNPIYKPEEVSVGSAIDAELSTVDVQFGFLEVDDKNNEEKDDFMTRF